MLQKTGRQGKIDHDDLYQLAGQLGDETHPSPGLFNQCYTDHEWYRLECDALFAKQWAVAGFAHDIESPGSVKPIEFVGHPLLLLRDMDGEIRVFENVCIHRGAILVEKPGRLKSGVLTCPYHAWCYRLDGRLHKTPDAGGPGQDTDDRLDKSQMGLRPVRHHVWMGMIFVNLSGDAPDFTTRYASLLERWSAFADQSLYHSKADSTMRIELEANWKLPVENYCESYHLPMVHPSLNSYSRLEDHYDIVEPWLYSGQGTYVYEPSFAIDGPEFTDVAGLPSAWQKCGEYIALYPNVLLGIHRDHFYAIILHPFGPDNVVQDVGIFYFDPQVLGEAYQARRVANRDLWRDIFAEDVGPIESMQKGRHARFFNGGVLTPAMEIPTRQFLRWCAGWCADVLASN
ncbi:MAG: aromatic ring-hydroxylating dioxygenase subunit alpha [Pseudomonadota bacterium]